jgi:ABC-type glycerol-3-phosphate transport system substrate-binding protein
VNPRGCLGVAIVAVASGCGDPAPDAPPIRFLHTFGPAETELFNAVIADRGIAVEVAQVPFARGQQVIGEILGGGVRCPDLIRIDATWLPALRARLLPPPRALAELDWTSAARALADGHAVPQSVDGLVVLYDRSAPAPPPDLAALELAARARRARGLAHPLGLRADGYWLVPWLRDAGADLAPGGLDGPGGVRALERFAALFGDLAPEPPASGTEARDEVRRWAGGELAYWVAGSWQAGTLDAVARERLAAAPLAHAPRGGQLLVVPRCAARPDDGWRLAAELTEIAVELRFATAVAAIPTRAAALADAPALSRALDAALRDAEPLSRDPRTPLLFDDLNPAVAAAVARDASATEAIEGVRRGWHRIAAP